MHFSPAQGRKLWTALTVAATLLWPLAATADLLCEHCSASSPSDSAGASSGATAHHGAAHHDMDHHGMDQHGTDPSAEISPEVLERAEHPSTSGDSPCCDGEGCAPDGRMAAGLPEVDGILPVSEPILGTTAFRAGPGITAAPSGPRTFLLPDLPRVDGAPVYLSVASFLL